MLGLLAVIFSKFKRELWLLIDVRIMLTLNILRNSGLLLHAKHFSGATDYLTILVFFLKNKPLDPLCKIH